MIAEMMNLLLPEIDKSFTVEFTTLEEACKFTEYFTHNIELKEDDGRVYFNVIHRIHSPAKALADGRTVFERDFCCNVSFNNGKYVFNVLNQNQCNMKGTYSIFGAALACGGCLIPE